MACFGRYPFVLPSQQLFIYTDTAVYNPTYVFCYESSAMIKKEKSLRIVYESFRRPKPVGPSNYNCFRRVKLFRKLITIFLPVSGTIIYEWYSNGVLSVVCLMRNNRFIGPVLGTYMKYKYDVKSKNCMVGRCAAYELLSSLQNGTRS